MSATYPERLARALELSLGAAEADTVLQLARVVAHGSERRFAPLSTYLAGQFVADRVRSGVLVEDALREAMTIAEGVLAGDLGSQSSEPRGP